jgi:hypothetical protein
MTKKGMSANMMIMNVDKVVDEFIAVVVVSFVAVGDVVMVDRPADGIVMVDEWFTLNKGTLQLQFGTLQDYNNITLSSNGSEWPFYIDSIKYIQLTTVFQLIDLNLRSKQLFSHTQEMFNFNNEPLKIFNAR